MEKLIHIVICFFIIFLSGLLSQPLISQAKWELKKEEDGIRVYTRKLGNKRFKELRIETKMKANLEEIEKAIENVKDHPLWVYKCEETKLIKQFAPGDFIYYVKMNFPFPLRDRDVLIHYKKFKNENSLKTITLSSGVADFSLVPKQGKTVRIEDYKSSYRFLETADGWVEISFYLKVDPAGSIPAWIVNLAVTKGPTSTMKGLLAYINDVF